MIARFWGKTAVPHTTRQTDAIAFLGSSFPDRGGSRAPCVNAIWGKEVCRGLFKGILRNIYNGTPSQALPKGIMPLGTPCGVCMSIRPKAIVLLPGVSSLKAGIISLRTNPPEPFLDHDTFKHPPPPIKTTRAFSRKNHRTNKPGPTPDLRGQPPRSWNAPPRSGFSTTKTHLP